MWKSIKKIFYSSFIYEHILEFPHDVKPRKVGHKEVKAHRDGFFFPIWNFNAIALYIYIYSDSFFNSLLAQCSFHFDHFKHIKTRPSHTSRQTDRLPIKYRCAVSLDWYDSGLWQMKAQRDIGRIKKGRRHGMHRAAANQISHRPLTHDEWTL